MALGVTEEHRQLADSVGRWAANAAPPNEAARATLDGDGPDLWPALAEQGLLGLHLPEEFGGVGYGLLEAAVVAERLGNACVPAPYVSAVLASALIHRHAPEALAKAVLPGLADGSRRAAVALHSGGLTARRDGDQVVLDGEVRPVQAAPGADLLVLGARDGDDEVWLCVDASDVEVASVGALDSTIALGVVTANGVAVPADRILEVESGGVRDLALVLYGAEAAGIAAWGTATAADYAKVREQFGRPIGQFQGVKHLCARMLVRTEMARAAAWDAAQAAEDGDALELAAAIAGATAVDAAHTVSLDCIQVLGGIGFTFEHDAHLFLRRGTTLRQLLGGPAAHRRRVADLALSGQRRTLHLELGEGGEVEQAREETRQFIESLQGLDDRARAERLADEGYVSPHWPKPYGREASPVEQLVIDDEFSAAGIVPPKILIGGWILPTIIGHGTDEQKERFVRSTLVGDIVWCQLFSEPGAGSDLASIQMKAVRVEGGWELTGQKIWTSLAHRAQWGLCIARTDPDAPKHEGITAFLIDMQNSEGLDIRPLKELTGNELFNEVFFDQVFVPDDLVVGPVNGGWKAARTTLANERVAMSKGSSMGASVESLLQAFPASAVVDDEVERDRVGGMIAEGQVLELLGHRTTLAQLSGTDPGAGSSVRKLVGGHHSKEVAEYVLELLGAEGASTEGPAKNATFMFLQTQCLTIAGGTTNVQLNVIAERLLGLPRDDAT